jgi:Trk K+ transport system NAD-binding subunit
LAENKILAAERDTLKERIEDMNSKIMNNEQLMEKSLSEINSLQVATYTIIIIDIYHRKSFRNPILNLKS